jgi:hypothetical protein
MIVNYDHNHSVIVLATVIMIINYDQKTFIVQGHRLALKKLFAAVINTVV